MQPPPVSIRASDLKKLKTYLINIITREVNANPISPVERKQAIVNIMQQAYQNTRAPLSDSYRDQLFHEILDELLGFGPIQPLLDDEEVSEIMVNGPNNVFIEQNGKLVKSNVTFENDEQVMRVIEKIILPLGRRIDADSPTVDARLPDGSRVNAVIPPCAIDGPCITIRKFKKDKLSVDKLIEYNTLTKGMADFARACVMARLNIVISGGTGSGKTTLLNALSGFIPNDERILTIEDAAELQLQQEHVVRLETKPPNSEGKNAVPTRELVRNALRMRPERIIIGECRGGEALDMLQAMNTGHDGSLTTLHANTPRDALSRLETMSLMAGMEIPLKVIRQQIASAINLIIQISRLKDGTRKVTSITEISGMEGETVVMSEIFKFEQTGIGPEGKIIGELKPTGIRPQFSPRLETMGFKLGPEIFGANLAEIVGGARRR